MIKIAVSEISKVLAFVSHGVSTIAPDQVCTSIGDYHWGLPL